MSKIHILDPIHVVLPEKEIFSRMRYNVHKTELPSGARMRIRSVIDRAFLLCTPRGRWARFDIVKKNDDYVELQGGRVIEGRSVSGLLAQSRSAVLMAVTVGGAVSEEASLAVNDGRGADALIYDAVGSETAEAAMDWLNRYVGQQQSRRGENLTKMRFSPGYGDLPLENQKIFYSLLDMGSMDVNLTEKYIFVPEKTVTALAGIE